MNATSFNKKNFPKNKKNIKNNLNKEEKRKKKKRKKITFEIKIEMRLKYAKNLRNSRLK